MNRILITINLVICCQVCVAKASFIAFNDGFDTLSNCEDCLIRPSEAKPPAPPPPHSELATALVKLQFSGNRLVVSISIFR